MRWINLEPVVRNEVDHKEKNKYHILTHTYEIEEKIVLMNLLQGRNRDTDTEDRFVDTVGEGEGGTNQDSSTDTYTLSCIKQETTV